MAAVVRNSSFITGTLAEILARSGLYSKQRGIPSDFNGCELYWNGSAWKWAKYWQPLSLMRTPFTVTAASTSEEVGMTFTLPAMGANDMLMIYHSWGSLTNNANAKTARVTLDGGGGVGSAVDMASSTVAPLVTIMRNMNSASSQRWMSNNKTVFGATSSTIQTTTKATGTAGKVLTVSGQKATGSDTMILEYADIWICGGD